MSVYDPPGDESTHYVPGLGLVQGIFIFVGICYIALGPVLGWVLSMDPTTPPGMASLMTVVMLGFGIVFGGLNFIVAWGLGNRSYWAWVLALILGALYLPSACLPLGGIILYCVLQPDFTAAFKQS